MSDVEWHLSETPTLVLAFASGGKKFEWGPTLAEAGVSYALFRDTLDRWYHDGVLGIGNLSEAVEAMRVLAKRHRRVVTLGLSSGAHAALMFGVMIPANEVIAVSPITAKGEAVVREVPPEWRSRVEHGPEHPPVVDIKRVWSRYQHRPAITAFISDGEGTELDRLMAERLGVIDIRFVPGHSHSGLARAVRPQIIEMLRRTTS